MEERVSNGPANLLFRPPRMLITKRRSLELSGGMIETLSSFQLLGRGHRSKDSDGFIIHARRSPVAVHQIPQTAKQGSLLTTSPHPRRHETACQPGKRK